MPGCTFAFLTCQYHHTGIVQVFKLDFSTNSHDLQSAGQPATCPEPFHRLSWNAFGYGTPEHEKYPVCALLAVDC